MNQAPRIALLADSFHEVNGAALTCRQLDAFARRRGLPFLSIHCGPAESFERANPCGTLQLKRGRFAIRLDRDLSFDPLLFLRRHEVLDALREFQPDIIHIASPGDLGTIGAWAAHVLRVPLVAAWHTNLHEFAARRIEKLGGALPPQWRTAVAAKAEHWILDLVLEFYRLAQVALAPNQELIRLIGGRTGKPVFPMTRGIDTTAYSPAHRSPTNGPFTLGFVGRLTPEKNVRFPARLEEALAAAGTAPFRILIVGDGSERAWLESHLSRAEFTGVLTGEALARAYAGMDVFVFPSHTDTYGNVVLEAMASGVPAIVTGSGGPKYLVRHGETGFVASTGDEFIAAVRVLMDEGERLNHMRRAAREHARQFCWDYVFEAEVYTAYGMCLEKCARQPAPRGQPGLAPA